MASMSGDFSEALLPRHSGADFDAYCMNDSLLWSRKADTSTNLTQKSSTSGNFPQHTMIFERKVFHEMCPKSSICSSFQEQKLS